MYSQSEMRLLSHLIEGAATIEELSEAAGLSKVQIYRTVASLEEKKAVRLERGEIIFEEQPHLYTMTNIMHDAGAATTLLAGNGLDIIKEMREPRTAKEVAERLGISQRTVSRSIKRMRNVSMLSKDGDRYVINDRIWPELRPLANRYAAYSESFDERVPTGSRIYHRSKELVVFSNDRDLKHTRTAFSRFGEYGIAIGLITQYYCNIPNPLTMHEIFMHCLRIITVEREWRLRMIALIFYKKYRNELNDIVHPMKDEMETVLRTKTGKVNGWVPLKEMQTRAEMYGVDLYDVTENMRTYRNGTATESSSVQKRHSIDELRIIVAPVAKKYGVSKIYLFGSVARGDYDENSDYDFCIERGKIRGLLMLSEFYQDLREAVGSKIDLVDTKHIEPDLLKTILSEGVVVYEE